MALLVLRQRRGRARRTSATPLRTLLPRGQGTIKKNGWHRTGTRYRQECRHSAWRQHKREEQRGWRTGIRLHAITTRIIHKTVEITISERGHRTVLRKLYIINTIAIYVVRLAF